LGQAYTTVTQNSKNGIPAQKEAREADDMPAIPGLPHILSLFSILISNP